MLPQRLNLCYNFITMATPTGYALTDPNRIVNANTGQTAIQAFNSTPVTTPIDTTMSADKLNTPTSGLNLGTNTPVTTPDISTLASAPTAPAPIVPIAPEIKPISLTDKLAGLFGQSKDKATSLESEKINQSAPYVQQLNELNTQIKMHQASSLARQEKALQSGETTGFASREAQNIARTDAINGLFLSAQAEGMRGNITLAEQHATSAINAKYAEIDKKIEEAKTNIINNFDSFSSSEKKKATQTLLRLDSNDFFAKTQVENEKAVQSVVLTSIQQSSQNGKPIPSIILGQAQKMTDPTQALQLLAPYIKDTAKIQTQIDAHNTSVAQQAKIYADIALSKEELKLKYSQKNGKPLTDAQATSLGYANRIAQAGIVIDKLGGQFTANGSLLGQYAPNILKSSDRQQFEQAQRNFINAVLRKESGAVISVEEFDNAKLQYLPQPGDTAKVLVQKKQNRDTVYQNLLRNSGQVNTQQDTQVVNGKTYTKAADGLYYPK